MNNDETEDGRSRKRRMRGLIAGIGLIGIGVAAIWTQRAPIATRLIDHELAKRRIPARYAIERLDANGAILTQLVLGNAAAPDLTATRVRVHIGWRLDGARISGIDLENVVARGRLDEKGLSFGVLDRLRPKSSAQTFVLPDLTIRLRNVRLGIATVVGPIGIATNGMGNLADGYRGRIAISAPSLDWQTCRLTSGRALVDVATTNRVIAAQGPISIVSGQCGRLQSGPIAAHLDVTVPEALDRAQGRIHLSARTVLQRGTVGASLIDATGMFTAASAKPSARFTGAIRWQGAQASTAWRKSIDGSAASLAATPLGPIADQVSNALARAMEQSEGSSQVAAVVEGKTGRISISNLGARAASGAQLTTTGRIFSWGWPEAIIRFDGKFALSGGGLPDARFDVQPLGKDAWQVLGDIAPYAAGGARLALSPVRIDWNRGQGHATTLAKMDGPLAGGTVRGLSIPIYVGFDRSGSVRVGGGRACVDVIFASMALSGLRIGETHLPLCSPRGDTLFAMDARGRLAGAISMRRLTLRGSLNGSALAADADNFRLGVTGTSAAPTIDFGLGPSAISLKQPEGETSLEFAALTGASARKGFEGTLGDASGAISGVPLLVDQASGRWRYAGGVLALDAPSARVRDAARNRRFEPISARNIHLALKNGVITGNAIAAHPANGKQLALVTLRHDLSSSRGEAVLDVPQLTFGDDLQPEALTPLTLGVIANTGGNIKGRGRIRWSAAGVKSDGVFESDGIGLSAAFGQVHNIKGRIVFDDLLNMTTPPGQTVTVGEMNPGVSVKDGIIRYQLLADQHVKVEEGRWPFAGGDLILEPTVLDFSKPSDRIFSLTVKGLDAAQFIQQFDFKNLTVTGRFDGTLPLLFNEKGGRIVGGRLVARQGGGKLAYVGEVSDADIGGAGKLAFDALKSLKYNALIIEMDGELDGEIISTVLFNGVNEAPVNPTGAALPVHATGLPFKFNITIKAPFRSLLNTAQSLTDVRSTVQKALPSGEDKAPDVPVKPSESEKVP